MARTIIPVEPVSLPPSSHGKPVDSFARAADLRQALKQRVRGEVRFDRGSRALYASDASNYRQVPIGVVVPRDADDVVAAVAVCREHDAPILPRGAGTSLAGQSCNVAVVIDFSKYMNRIRTSGMRGFSPVSSSIRCARGRNSIGSRSVPIPRRTAAARSAA
jgi:FAD binding domain